MLDKCFQQLKQLDSLNKVKTSNIILFLIGRSLSFINDAKLIVEASDFLKQFWANTLQINQNSADELKKFEIGVIATSELFDGVAMTNSVEFPPWLQELANSCLQNILFKLPHYLLYFQTSDCKFFSEIVKIFEFSWQANNFSSNHVLISNLIECTEAIRTIIKPEHFHKILLLHMVPTSTVKLSKDFEQSTESYDQLILNSIHTMIRQVGQHILPSNGPHLKTSRIFISLNFQNGDTDDYIGILYYIQDSIRYLFCRKKKVLHALNEEILQLYLSIIFSGTLFMRYVQVAKLAQNILRKFFSLLSDKSLPIQIDDVIFMNYCIFEIISNDHLAIQESAVLYSIFSKEPLLAMHQSTAIRYLLGIKDIEGMNDSSFLQMKSFLTTKIKEPSLRLRLTTALLDQKTKLNTLREILRESFS